MTIGKHETKKELEAALKMLGSRLVEKGYTKEQLLNLAKAIRKEVYSERVTRNN